MNTSYLTTPELQNQYPHIDASQIDNDIICLITFNEINQMEFYKLIKYLLSNNDAKYLVINNKIYDYPIINRTNFKILFINIEVLQKTYELTFAKTILYLLYCCSKKNSVFIDLMQIF